MYIFGKFTNNYRCRLVELQNEMNEQVPVKKYTEARTVLLKWINDVEGMLLSEHVVLTHPQAMEQQLVKFQVSDKKDDVLKILGKKKFLLP